MEEVSYHSIDPAKVSFGKKLAAGPSYSHVPYLYACCWPRGIYGPQTSSPGTLKVIHRQLRVVISLSTSSSLFQVRLSARSSASLQVYRLGAKRFVFVCLSTMAPQLGGGSMDKALAE